MITRNQAKRASFDVAVYETTGTITEVAGEYVEVRFATGRVRARRARSCLVEPRVGDLALVCMGADLAYVLAILEGRDEVTTIASSGDLEIKLTGGRLDVSAQDGISLVTGAEVKVVAGRFSLRTLVATAALDGLSWIAGTVVGEVERLKLTAASVDRVVDRVTERVKRAYRKVEELDRLDVENADWEARKNMTVHCENALVTADKLIKMDADQVHIG
jgi:hypothetical protein